MFLDPSCGSSAAAALEALARVHRRIDEAHERLAVISRAAAPLVEATQWQTESARRFSAKSTMWGDDVAQLAAVADDISATVRGLQAWLSATMWEGCS